MHNKKNGYTLVEMCLSLIIITILIAVATPMITKKMTHKEEYKEQPISTNCPEFQSTTYIMGISACSLCYKNYKNTGKSHCIQCDLPNQIGFGYAVDTANCDYIECSYLHPGCSSSACDETECFDNP